MPTLCWAAISFFENETMAYHKDKFGLCKSSLCALRGTALVLRQLPALAVCRGAVSSCSCPSRICSPHCPSHPRQLLGWPSARTVGSRRHNSAARAAWTEMGAACGKGKSIQLVFFTFLLSFSSVESWNGHPFWTRAYALNDPDMDTWTYTQTHTCAHTPSLSYLLHMDSKQSWRILWSLSIQWL